MSSWANFCRLSSQLLMSISLDFHVAVLRLHSLPHATAGSLVYALYSFTNHSQACWNETGFLLWLVNSVTRLFNMVDVSRWQKNFWDHLSTEPCNRTQMWQLRPGFCFTENGGGFPSKLHKKRMWRHVQALQTSDPAVAGRRIHNWTPKMAGNRAYMSICIFLRTCSHFCAQVYILNNSFTLLAIRSV